MRKNIIIGLIAGIGFLGTSLQAQIFKYGTDRNHNHYSIESIETDLVMAGTLFQEEAPISHEVHAQRVDASGAILWERTYDIGDEERCLGMTIQEDWMVLTGTVRENDRNSIFVMRLEASTGTVVDYVTLPAAGTSYPDQVGRDIIYSANRDQYFIGGWGATNIQGFFSEGGILLCLDGNLNVVWGREIPNGHISTVVDMDNRGLFVTGKVATSFQSNLAMAFNYSGGLVWQRNANMSMGTGAAYDSPNDKIYMVTTNEVAEISGAATGGATITQAKGYAYAGNITYMGLENLWDIKLKPGSNELAVYGGIVEDGNTGYHSFPTMIMLDRSNLSVVNASYVHTYNSMYVVHDEDYFEARQSKTNTNTLISYQGGFSYVSYESKFVGSTEYYVNATITDGNGKVESECNTDVPISSRDLDLYLTQASANAISNDLENPAYDEVIQPHGSLKGCFDLIPCDVTINSFQRTQLLGCNEAEFTVTASTSAGATITQYFWDWGDGTSSTTTTPTTTHLFAGFIGQNCTSNVCVTITTTGVNGSVCTDQACMGVSLPFSTYFGGFPCPTCDLGDPEKAGQSENQSSAAVAANITLTPNPASDFVQISGFEGMIDITITDIQGRPVFTGAVKEAQPLDVSSFDAGIYIVSGQHADGQKFQEKFIVD